LSGSTRTQDFYLAAACLYLYGNDALLSVTDLDDRKTEFFLAVPELDFQEIQQEYRTGTLAISDLNSFVRALKFIKKKEVEFRRAGECGWTSPAWIAGRGN
jgi:hypothetical protein